MDEISVKGLLGAGGGAGGGGGGKEQGGSLRDNHSVVRSLFGEEFGKKPNDAVGG